MMGKRNFVMAFVAVLMASNVSLMGMEFDSDFVENIKRDGLRLIDGFSPEDKAAACEYLISSQLIRYDFEVQSIKFPAARMIRDLGDAFQDRAAQAFLMIAQNSGIHGAYRIDALIDLEGFSDDYNTQKIEAALSLARDNSASLSQRYRFSAIEKVLRLSSQYNDEMIQLLTQIGLSVSPESDINHDLLIRALNILTTRYPSYANDIASLTQVLLSDDIARQ